MNNDLAHAIKHLSGRFYSRACGTVFPPDVFVHIAKNTGTNPDDCRPRKIIL